MGSVISQAAVSSEKSIFRMSGRLSENLDDTTLNVHMTNTCSGAGQLPNKMLIYILGNREALPHWHGCGRLALLV
jgi:hypothetical protein